MRSLRFHNTNFFSQFFCFSDYVLSDFLSRFLIKSILAYSDLIDLFSAKTEIPAAIPKTAEIKTSERKTCLALHPSIAQHVPYNTAAKTNIHDAHGGGNFRAHAADINGAKITK